MGFIKRLAAQPSRLIAERLKNKAFIRNMLTIATGTAISQVATLAAMPLLSRMYSPSDFGLLASFMALSNIASQVACLGYQSSVVLPKRNESAFILWVTCICLGLITSGITLAIVIFNAEYLAQLLGNPDLQNWLWLIPVTMFIWAGFESTSYWSTRHKKFTQISTGLVTNRGSTVLLQLGFGTLQNPSASGLITGHVLGSLAGFGILMRHATQNIDNRYWKALGFRKAALLLRRYQHFFGFGLLSSLTAAAVRALPVICLGYFFNPAIVGFYAMANRLVTAPFQLVNNSLFKVFYERANRAKQAGNLGALTTTLYERMVILLVTPLALLGIAAPDLILILLGDKWVETSMYLRWLSGWLLFVASVSCLDRLYLIVERQVELAIANVALFIASTASLIFGGLANDPQLAMGLFCISTSLVRLIQGMRTMSLAGGKKRIIFLAPMKELVYASPFIITMISTCYFSDSRILILLVFISLVTIFAISRAKSIFRSAKPEQI